MENPNTTENATEATTPATETAAEKPVKQQRMLPPENKVLFETLRVKVWGKDVPLTDIFRARSVVVDGAELTLCSNDAGGGCAEEVGAAETRPTLVLKGEDSFFLAPLCPKCGQAVGHFRYEIRKNVANDEKHPRCGDARRLLSHTVVCKGKAEAEARLAEVSAPKVDPRAERDAAFAALVEYFRALRTEERFMRGGGEMVKVRMSDEVMLPLASSKRPGAYFGKCVPMSPKSRFGAFGVVKYPDGWRVIALSAFELSAIIKAGARDLLFNGWLYQPRDDEELTEELEDKLFREAELRALELTQKGEEGVRKADRQARFEARKAGGGNRGNGGGGGGGQGRETKAAPQATQAVVSDPAPQADPIAIAADADKTRARERHAERKERRGDGEGKPGRRNGRRSDEDGEFHQEMELEGSRRNNRGRKGKPTEDDRSWAEHTSAGNGSAKLGDQFGSLLSKVPVAPGPNGQ